MKKKLTKKAREARYHNETNNIAIVQAFCEVDIHDALRDKKTINEINTNAAIVQLDPHLTSVLNDLSEKHGSFFVFALGMAMEGVPKRRKTSAESIATLANHKALSMELRASEIKKARLASSK